MPGRGDGPLGMPGTVGGAPAGWGPPAAGCGGTGGPARGLGVWWGRCGEAPGEAPGGEGRMGVFCIVQGRGGRRKECKVTTLLDIVNRMDIHE